MWNKLINWRQNDPLNDNSLVLEMPDDYIACTSMLEAFFIVHDRAVRFSLLQSLFKVTEAVEFYLFFEKMPSLKFYF